VNPAIGRRGRCPTRHSFSAEDGWKTTTIQEHTNPNFQL